MITVINVFSDRTFTRIEGLKDGRYRGELFDQIWKPVSNKTLKATHDGLILDFTAPSRCHAIVLNRVQ